MCQTLSDVSWLKTSILQSDAVFPARDAVKAIPCALRGAVISFYWKDKWTCCVRGNWIAPVRRARVRKRPAAARNMQSAALPILHFICLIDAPRVAGLYLETGFIFLILCREKSKSHTERLVKVSWLRLWRTFLRLAARPVLEDEKSSEFLRTNRD